MTTSSSSSSGSASGASPTKKPRPSTSGPKQRARSPLPPPPVSPNYPPPLLLTIRFSTSLPDLHLDIPRPHTTTVASLKGLIRSRLAAPPPEQPDDDGDSRPDDNEARDDARRRLRFIHGGRILPDAAVLSAVLKAPPAPPPALPRRGRGAGDDGDGDGDGDGDDDGLDPKGKGKGVTGRPRTRVYVNCSIGHVLTDAELADEAEAAARPAAAAAAAAAAASSMGQQQQQSPTAGSPGLAPPLADQQHQQQSAARQRRGPRGFDRLLGAGFAPAEVNALRLQFRSIHAARHTPDTMPSPDTLRGMEDAWIDDNNSSSSSNGGAGGGGGGIMGPDGNGNGEAEADDALGVNGLLDVLLRGMLVGFVWPLGSIGWLVREEGLWAKRLQVFATFGFVLSLTIGMIRSISGDK